MCDFPKMASHLRTTKCCLMAVCLPSIRKAQGFILRAEKKNFLISESLIYS